MASSILQELTDDKASTHLSLPILETIYPAHLIGEILTDLHAWGKRERKINALSLVLLLMAWTILPAMSLSKAWTQLTSALRWLFPDAQVPVLTSAAFCYQRQRLGEAPLRRLMREACVPLCQPQTPGAFQFGLRLIAIDSKLFDVSETAETDWTFRGRTQEDQPRQNSPFPQLRLLSALEIGSHAHVAAVVAAGSRSEMAKVFDLLPFLPQHSLVLQDSGFRGAWWLQRLQQHGHQCITRLHATDLPCRGPRLEDGSYLVQARGSGLFPLPTPLTLRVVEYRLDERISQPLSQLQRSRARSSTRTSQQGPQIFRLATTLLDPQQAPALEIAACYQQRWEVELVYDELQEHQQVAERLQSHTALTARQELWAMILGHYALRAWMMRSASQAVWTWTA